MTLFFALVASQPAFFDSAIHGDTVPANAIEITPARHAELLNAQAIGKEIYADEDGRPRYRQRQIDADEIRANLVAAIRDEAARRINAVSPVWRQMNDQRQPSKAGAARFAQIDAIRAVSQRLEAELTATPDNLLSQFSPSRPDHWKAH